MCFSGYIGPRMTHTHNPVALHEAENSTVVLVGARGHSRALLMVQSVPIDEVPRSPTQSGHLQDPRGVFLFLNALCTWKSEV